jgi:DNA replication protein DnaC
MTSEESNLNDTVSKYWATYPTVQEASQASKGMWSDGALQNGVLRTALAVVVNSADPSSSQPVLEAAHGVVAISRAPQWRGLRTQILGVEALTLEGAQALVSELHDRAREAICFCVLPGVFKTAEELMSKEFSWIRAGTVVLYPDDIDALARRDWTFLELVEYKLFRAQVLEKPAPETQYDSKLFSDFKTQSMSATSPFLDLQSVVSNFPDDHRRWAKHPSTDRVRRAVLAGRSCLLIGQSSSGKTVMALKAGEECTTSAGTAVRYLNLGTMAASPLACFSHLASRDTGGRRVYVVDDLQSSPPVARYIANIINLLRRSASYSPPALIAVSWPDFAESAAQFIEDCLPIHVRAKDVRQSIISTYTHDNQLGASGDTFEAVKDDLQLLRIFLDVRDQTHVESPTLPDIAKSYWERRILGSRLARREAMRAVQVVATLGRYDVLVPRDFVQQEAQVAASVIEELLRRGLLRLSTDLLTVGHRSLASLLGDWLSAEGVWRDLTSLGGPEDPFSVVRDYLRTASPASALGTLQALHARAGFKESEKLNSRTASLVATWKAFTALLERIRHQQGVDPRWRSVPASIMFVVQSLAEIDRAEEAQSSILYLREKYGVDQNGLAKINTGEFSTRMDFELIADAIKRQDASYAEAGLTVPPFWEPADRIDIDRFHRTWLLGVILCAESAYRGTPDRDLNVLADAVIKEQLESGAFYPERAVWSTARVCLGLASTGRSVHTSPALKKAIEWLLTSREQGGPCDAGLWRSGTGDWNSDLEVTAMTLLACLAAGLEPDDTRLLPARTYLISQSNQWTAAGRELDGALAAQAYLEAGGAWDEISGQIQKLSDWAQGEAFWRTATMTSKESFEQSCRVAQTAFHLFAIGWSALRADLPLLLQALDAPEGLWRSATRGFKLQEPMIPAQIPRRDLVLQSHERGHDGILQALERISGLSLEELSVVGNYCRFDQKTRNSLKDWHMRIVQNFHTKMCTHENFLIWAAPGSGKSFFVGEIGESLRNKGVKFVGLNLAKDSQKDFQFKLDDLSAIKEPTLCMVDEIDARSDEAWPYDVLFSHLDRNLSSELVSVFVLIGSSRAGMNGMIQEMLTRKKGQDLLDRIPIDRRFEIPAMCIEDKAVVFASNLREAAKNRGQAVKYIEKFALFFILSEPEFNSPRQLRDLAYSAVGRMVTTDDRMHYDNLFAVGERRNQQFWGEHQEAANELANLYVSL